MSKISFAIPCYQSRDTITDVVDEIRSTTESHKNNECDIVLVNGYLINLKNYISRNFAAR